MKSETHVFRKLCSNEDVAVGSTLQFSDGSEGVITSIKSVKFINMHTIEVIGRAKFEISTK
ncbi:hypothetical protein COL60_16510 [Bacillus pseudomycoides]|uniref:hypothetical protein n=1 Tax=Bacillus pseudomycoides TaxID=64104 RepID=UPI000BF3A00C|nr:hypothetical protein [Bacillus pseudomycoides]PFZ08428.1 hypothetical protein COL60_16510 [Bacillus pseudomycoides]PFZ09834.1 hypothetical protein COL63_21440 [Bacillus pseudomycoides]